MPAASFAAAAASPSSSAVRVDTAKVVSQVMSRDSREKRSDSRGERGGGGVAVVHLGGHQRGAGRPHRLGVRLHLRHQRDQLVGAPLLHADHRDLRRVALEELPVGTVLEHLGGIGLSLGPAPGEDRAHGPALRHPGVVAGHAELGRDRLVDGAVLARAAARLPAVRCSQRASLCARSCASRSSTVPAASSSCCIEREPLLDRVALTDEDEGGVEHGDHRGGVGDRAQEGAGLVAALAAWLSRRPAPRRPRPA